MSKALRCEMCGMGLGEVSTGRVRLGAVLLCKGCWGMAKAAVDVARSVKEEMPSFLSDLFRGRAGA